MTTSDSSPDETPPAEPQSPASADTPPSDGGDAIPSQTPPAEGLPEEFELTPELVEEEAIRGDFVLRWAAILLAFLVACTTIDKTDTLVHVKAGQYLATHGVIPDGTDPFAYTTEGRVWRNQAWLFDLALAGVYRLGADTGLTVFKALLAAAVFWCVVNISRPNTSTWWNAMVAAAGAIACIPFFTARPEIVTLLGCALVLYFLHTARYSRRDKIDFRLPVLFLFWCNLDPRMFIGLLLLFVYVVGESLRKKDRDDAPLLDKKSLWLTFAACVAVSLINPFGWHSLTGAVDLYTVADPLYRKAYANGLDLEKLKWFNLLHDNWWTTAVRTVPFPTALALGALAVVSLYLNYTGIAIPELLLLLAFGGLAFATGREIGPAVVVMCVITNLNCQDWYRESFAQTYSVSKWELLFSRGGRAVTVLALVACAWMAMKGIVYRGYHAVVGFGFEQILETALTGFETDLVDQLDNRPFNFSYEQGDTLIWADQRVFIDTRLPLFTGSGDDDLIALHDRTRRSIRQKTDDDEYSGRPDVWQATFDRYHITHAIPRLSGDNPDYVSYLDLLVEPRFMLTKLGPSVAVFYRVDPQDPKLVKYLRDHELNFFDLAFRSKVDELKLRGVFPSPPDVYDRYLTAERISRPADLSLAMHYIQHLVVRDVTLRFAFSYLAIRHCNQVLVEDPSNQAAFSVLGMAYTALMGSERSLCNANGKSYDPSMRYYQAMLAYNQALVVQPDFIPPLERLRTLYIDANRLDLAIDVCRRLDEIASKNPQLVRSDAVTSNQEILQDLEKQVNPVLDEINGKLEKKEIEYQTAVQALMQNGLFRNALLILEKHAGTIDQDDPAYPLYGVLLLENGRLEEAYGILINLEDLFLQNKLAPQLHFVAIAELGHGDFGRAARLFEEEGNIIQDQLLGSQLTMLPLVSDFDAWSLQRFAIVLNSNHNDSNRLADVMWQRAAARIEEGQFDKARQILETLKDVVPNASIRVLACAYYSCLTGKQIDISPPDDRIPVAPDIFAPEPQAENK